MSDFELAMILAASTVDLALILGYEALRRGFFEFKTVPPSRRKPAQAPETPPAKDAPGEVVALPKDEERAA